MDNFLEFILKDIDTKKTIDSTAPTKTKTNRKKLYNKLEEYESKYNDYLANIKNYLFAKEKALKVKETEKDLTDILQRIKVLEEVKFLHNPSNTYFEKMGFDILLYQLNHYYVFNFNSLNKIINGFLDKFEQAGIALQSEDFNYTFYVHEYMTSFLEVYYKKSANYNKVSEVFEELYYMNPEIISHIELNFRKLIKKNRFNFINYIAKMQKKVLVENNVGNFNECVEELKSLYNQLSLSNGESVSDIIDLAKKREIDISQYFEDNKIRKTAFDTVIANNINYNDPKQLDEICLALSKLKINMSEYQSYLDFLPLFNNFKEEYSKLLTETSDKKYTGLKDIEDTIERKENELARINRKIFGGKISFLDFKANDSRALKIESVCKAKELHELYKIYDQEYFKSKVMLILDKTLTIADLLNLYYSFDYFKKLAIEKVYKSNSYDEIVEYSDKFDSFANNLSNVVMQGVLVFEDTNIVRNIANKYRLHGIKIEEADLDSNNLSNLMNKVSLILRVNLINNSSTSLEKIWFMTKVQEIKDKDEKNNNN